jgi:sorbitol-specific phosphotransferase system component IIBC
MIVLQAIALYAVAGFAIAISFLAFGVTRVLATHSTVTLGARIVLLPRAVALWPYVLIRWLRSFR